MNASLVNFKQNVNLARPVNQNSPTAENDNSRTLPQERQMPASLTLSSVRLTPLILGMTMIVAALIGSGASALASDADKAPTTGEVKAVDTVAAVTIPSGPVKGMVLGEAWEIHRAKISGDKLSLYADASKGIPVFEIEGLTEAIHSSLGKPLLEKALSGDKAAQAKLQAIPAKPPLESARIAFDKEDGLLGATTAQIRRSGGQVYHCDVPLPLVIEFGKKANGKLPMAIYIRHDGIAGDRSERILLAGHVDAVVE